MIRCSTLSQNGYGNNVTRLSPFRPLVCETEAYLGMAPEGGPLVSVRTCPDPRRGTILARFQATDWPQIGATFGRGTRWGYPQKERDTTSAVGASECRGGPPVAHLKENDSPREGLDQMRGKVLEDEPAPYALSW